MTILHPHPFISHGMQVRLQVSLAEHSNPFLYKVHR
jgi:hypothetical protein